MRLHVVTAPEFNTVDVVALSNGNIRILLKLRHTGGYDRNDVSIDGYCSTDIDYMIGSASGQMETNAFTYSCDTQCIDDRLRTSFSFGAVTAGTMYYCSVIASNMIGSVTQRNNLVPLIGIINHFYCFTCVIIINRKTIETSSDCYNKSRSH